MVCAMAGARRGRGFEPRFVCLSRGPSVRPPPPPPSASRSTIGTAGASGGVSPPSFSCPLPQPLAPWHTQKRGTRHGTPAAARPVTATAVRRVAHVLLIVLFRLLAEEDLNSGLQVSSRLHSRCTTLPKPRPGSGLSIPPASPALNVPECFSVCVWLGGGTQHTINLGEGDGGTRAPPRAVFVVCCAVQD